MKLKIKKNIPFDFVIERVASLEPVTRPMFGCTAVYVGEKIMFVLRSKEEHPEDNGVWLATDHEHHASLKKELPIMRSIFLLGNGPTAWQNLPADDSQFEEMVEHACDLALKGDERIGRVTRVRVRNKRAR